MLQDSSESVHQPHATRPDTQTEIRWYESLFQRRRALDDAYWGYLLRAFFAWGLTWFLLFGCLIFAEWVLERRPWFDRRGVETIVISTAFGVFLRIILEMFPREVTCTPTSIVVNHCNYYRRKVLVQDANLTISQIDDGLSRLTLRGYPLRRAILLGIPSRYLGQVKAMLKLQEQSGGIWPLR